MSDEKESYPHFAQVFVEKWKTAVDIVHRMWKTAGIKMCITAVRRQFVVYEAFTKAGGTGR